MLLTELRCGLGSPLRRGVARALGLYCCVAGGGASGGGTKMSLGMIEAGEGCDSSCGSNEKSRCN
jgi:hypothetical protein